MCSNPKTDIRVQLMEMDHGVCSCGVSHFADKSAESYIENLSSESILWWVYVQCSHA